MQLKTKFKRAASAFMAFVLMFGMLPGGVIQASAADSGAPADKITMDHAAANNYVIYYSDVLNKVHLRPNLLMYVDGEATPGWCNDHSKALAYTSAGYSNPVKYEDNSVATPFLDMYMTCYERNEEIRQASGLTDATAIKDWLTDGGGEAYGWSKSSSWYLDDWELRVVNAAVQAAVWLYASGTLTESSTIEEKATLIGTERYNGLVAMGWTSRSLETCIQDARDVYKYYTSGEYNHYEYYVYSPNSNASTTQTIIIPKLVKDYSGYIKLKKVDENGQPLAGAVFGVYADEDCKQAVTDNITTTTDKWNYSSKISLAGKTQTLYVKEISAPSSNDPDSPYVENHKVFPVTVDSTVNNTKETAAAVNDGTAIKNVKLARPGVVNKVDANGNPIGPATFNFYSIEKNTDRTITSNASGVIELQWLDKDKENYIAPGEYRVTEVIAPPGYVKSDESQNIKFWIEYLDDGTAVQMNSGPLTFKNEMMRKVKVMKVDGSGKPLSGAAFDIYKDGTKIGSATTGSDGSFTYSGVDGNGLDSGYYEFVETSAPGGYLIPTDNRLSVTIDTSDPSQPELITLGPLKNYEYPEIRIKKLISGTNDGLAGAVFQVRIDGKMLDEVFLFIECRPKKMIEREIFS